MKSRRATPEIVLFRKREDGAWKDEAVAQAPSWANPWLNRQPPWSSAAAALPGHPAWPDGPLGAGGGFSCIRLLSSSAAEGRHCKHSYESHDHRLGLPWALTWQKVQMRAPCCSLCLERAVNCTRPLNVTTFLLLAKCKVFR